MRSMLRPLAACGALLYLTSLTAMAAPGPGNEGPGQQQQQQRQQSQHNPQQQYGQQGGGANNGSRHDRSRDNHGSEPRHQDSGSHQPGPPSDFGQARQDIRQHRDLIGRGPALPPNVHIAKGHPLPQGYGKRLSAPVLAQLPRYQGYEWRRVGSDMVLVALTTGIVYEILSGVLD